jgi:integrase
MRPKFQKGQIELRGKEWFLRYYAEKTDVGGGMKRVRTRAFLAAYSDFPCRADSPADMEKLRQNLGGRIADILAPVNGKSGGLDPAKASALTVADFIERSYLPRLEWRLRQSPDSEFHVEPSTVKGYRDIFRSHVQNSPFAAIRVMQFGPQDGRQFLESLPKHLHHQTHMRIKNFMRGVFAWAIADGAYSSTNPMAGQKAGGRTKADSSNLTLRQRKIKASNEHAYTLKEVALMIKKLPEPARTVCITAAFTGLTRSELRGLKWSDYDGKTIQVKRKIWGTYEGPTKTEARQAGIHVVPLLKRVLTKYRKKFPPMDEGWIFRGEKNQRPLNLDNLSRREIPDHINGAWFGWHAFRRGLGSRLNEAGVDANTIQEILRHADVKTTMQFYILPDKAETRKAMRELAQTIRIKYDVKA